MLHGKEHLISLLVAIDNAPKHPIPQYVDLPQLVEKAKGSVQRGDKNPLSEELRTVALRLKNGERLQDVHRYYSYVLPYHLAYESHRYTDKDVKAIKAAFNASAEINGSFARHGKKGGVYDLILRWDDGTAAGIAKKANAAKQNSATSEPPFHDDGRRQFDLSQASFKSALTAIGKDVYLDIVGSRMVMCDLKTGRSRTKKKVDTLRLKTKMKESIRIMNPDTGTVSNGWPAREFDDYMGGHLAENQRNPFYEWVRSLDAPGVDCEQILQSVFNMPDTAEVRWVSKFLFMSPIQRIFGVREFEEGAFDDDSDDDYLAIRVLPVLVGAPDIGKSTFLRSLLPRSLRSAYHSESFKFVGTDKIHDYTRGLIYAEWSEIADLWVSLLGALKGFISRSSEFYRIPYDIQPSQHPRSVTIIGTANPDEELVPANADDGLIQRLPVLTISAGGLNEKHLVRYMNENRSGAFVDALQRFRDGDRVYEVPKEYRPMLREGIESLMAVDEVMVTRAQSIPAYKGRVSTGVLAVHAGIMHKDRQWVSQDEKTKRGFALALKTARFKMVAPSRWTSPEPKPTGALSESEMVRQASAMVGDYSPNSRQTANNDEVVGAKERADLDGDTEAAKSHIH